MKRKTDAKLLFPDESYIIQGGAFNVYKEFRNRHKENVYQRALAKYLGGRGLSVSREKQIPIYFQGTKVGAYTPDIVVDDSIFIELKCKSSITADDMKQFWYYLRCSTYKVGYLINFGTPRGVQMVRRVYDTARK